MKHSAGIVLYKRREKDLLFFLVHPGGPYWKNKDEGAWSIPKGEFTDSEDPLTAALREFKEETGFDLERKSMIPLNPIKTRSGKIIHAWAQEKNLDCTLLKSNMFEMEWPPRSGNRIMVPEVDRGAWFDYPAALKKINPSQISFINQLVNRLAAL